MHSQDCLAIFEFRKRDNNLAVESARAQQCWVEDVGPVGGRHHDDAFGGFETVHLRQHLVERLLTFVVAATHTGATFAADRVDFVDEDDGFAQLAS